MSKLQVFGFALVSMAGALGVLALCVYAVATIQ